jgi:hypothetical protein
MLHVSVNAGMPGRELEHESTMREVFANAPGSSAIEIRSLSPQRTLGLNVTTVDPTTPHTKKDVHWHVYETTSGATSTIVATLSTFPDEADPEEHAQLVKHFTAQFEQAAFRGNPARV